mgnify:CR=1 FL=1
MVLTNFSVQPFLPCDQGRHLLVPVGVHVVVAQHHTGLAVTQQIGLDFSRDAERRKPLRELLDELDPTFSGKSIVELSSTSTRLRASRAIFGVMRRSR